jgi:hypothetical protein
MIVYFLPSVSGLTRWVDYIPVKFTTVATAATENTYNQNGYIPVVSLSSIAGATPFKEYVPVFLDSSAADADVWDVTITGFIPVGTAGIGGAALYLDFAATTSLDPRITFSRTTNATVTGSNGLIQNAPMNLLTFSEQFDNASWVKDSGTVEANSALAPDGTSTADKYVPNTTSASDHRVRKEIPVTAVVNYSCYVKAAGYSWVKIRASTGWANVNLTDGTVGFNANATNISVQSVGNGWFRCSLSVSAAAFAFVYVYALPDNATNSIDPAAWSGDGTSGIYVWGAQLEVGSTATTYNPTTVKNLLGFTENFDNASWTKSNAFVQTNLFSYSSDFSDSSWSKGTATITNAATIAPDGTQTASLEVLAAGTTA